MTPSAVSPKVPGYRWRIVALLFIATTINYMDRQILSLVKPLLDTELHWTNLQFGAVNSAFQGAYAIGLFFFGWIIDKLGVRRGYALSVGAWSIFAMAHALVGSIAGFTVVRVLLGLGEAGNFPGAIKAVTRWFPKAERSFATSLFNSGANVAAIIAPATIPFIAAAWGWRAAFVIAGLIGLLWLIFWFPIYRRPTQHPKLSPEELAYIGGDGAESEPDHDIKVPWAKLLARRETWSFVVGKLLTDPVWYFFLTWLPGYLHDAKGLDMKSLGAPLVGIYGIVTVLSIIGGWIPGRLIARGMPVSRARKVCMFGFALCALPILGIKGTGLWGAVALIGIAGAAHQAWMASLYTTVSDMFPKYAVGSVVGLGGMAGSFGGMIFPVVCGYIIDHYKAAGSIDTGYGILFGVCSVAYVLAFALNHFLAPKFDRVSSL